MRKFLLVLIFLFSTSTLLLAQERYGPYKIHKFVDGDTFWVKIGVGKTEKIRPTKANTTQVRWDITKKSIFLSYPDSFFV
uniref:hypothetical protein n=1 Tax=Algoriphagus locisalis TaxID=305507 RepID=UPI000B8630F6|nr:hypothetical protein [Algoriphagus locisalis]